MDITITVFIKQQEELFEHYYAVNGLVLPSYDEHWGLVVNEAMTAGLPVIVSYGSAASLDLVKDGVNGFVLRELDDHEKLKQVILIDSHNKDLFAKNSISIITKWNFLNSRKI